MLCKDWSYLVYMCVCVVQLVMSSGLSKLYLSLATIQICEYSRPYSYIILLPVAIYYTYILVVTISPSSLELVH